MSRHLPHAGLVLLLIVWGCEGDRLTRTVPLITPSSDTVTLGPIYLGQTTSRVVTLRSSGNGPLALRAAHVDGPAVFTVNGFQPRTLQPGETADVTVGFLAESEGNVAADLVVDNDSDNAPALRIALSGQASGLPNCDDDNPCTNDSFDVTQEQCRHESNTASCDDANACTESDRCVDGACLGLALTCVSEDPCARSLCDPTSGCITVADPLVCEDDNPCTVDVCDVEDGCRNDPAPDGTGCGAGEGCISIRLCVSGACQPFDAPDGTRCDDGSFCTTDDRCVGGACAGTLQLGTPQVVAQAFTFGGPGTVVAMLGNDRMLFADGVLQVVLTLVYANPYSGELEVLRQLALPLEGVWSTHLRELDDDLVALTVRDDAYDEVVRLVRVTDETITLLGAVDVLDVHAVARAGNVLFTCGNTLQGVDITDPSSPSLGAGLPLPTACSGMAVVGDTLWIGTAQGLVLVDVADPANPQELQTLFETSMVQAVAAMPPNVVVLKDELNDNQVADVSFIRRDGDVVVEAAEVPDLVWGELDATGNDVVLLHNSGSTTLYTHDLQVLRFSSPTESTIIAGDTLTLGTGNVGLRVRDGLIVTTRTDGSAIILRRFGDGTLAGLQRLTGKQHGDMVLNVAAPGQAIVIAHDAVHRVAMGADGRPVFLSGHVLDHGAHLLSTGDDVTPTYFLVPLAPGPDRRRSAPPLSAPLPLLSWDNVGGEIPVHIGIRNTTSIDAAVSDGQRLVATGDGPSILIFDLRDLGGASVILQPVAQVTLALPPQATVSSSIPVLDRGGLMAGGIFVHSFGSTVMVTDATTPVMSLVGQTEIFGNTREALIAQGRIAILSEDRLEVRDLVEGLPLRANHPMVGGSVILDFDGSTALVSMRDGIDFIDFTVDPPVVRGTVLVPRHTTSVLFNNDRLEIVSPTAYSVVSPACPSP